MSCSGTLTEDIALFVENNIKDIAHTHESYLQDTPDFLRYINNLNAKGDLPNNAMIVVVDVIGLFDNIPPEEGVRSVGEALSARQNSKVPVQLIMRLLETRRGRPR